MAVRKFRLIDYEVKNGIVDVTTGILQEMIEGEPCKDTVWEKIDPCDELTIGYVIFQKQKNGRFRKVYVCGNDLDLDLIKRENLDKAGATQQLS